jgi:hypothetical protein
MDASVEPPAKDSGAPLPDPGTPGPPPAPSSGKFVIDSLTGELTKHEVDTFISVASAISIPTTQSAGGSHNDLADGGGGTQLEAINLLCEATGDIPALANEHVWLLDLAIKWSDVWLSHRNDQPLGEKRVMWTGQVDPIWPPNPAPSKYAASEVGETVGILAFTALNILRTPAIANHTVPDGDPNHYGATYGARAKTYVSMLEFTMDKFFNAYFVDRTNFVIRHPVNQPEYETYSANNVNAWNREMMFLHAWQQLGQIHDLLGDDPAKADMYKKICVNTVAEFVKNAVPTMAPDGTPVYDWGYGNYGDWMHGSLHGEQLGIHAQYDIWGLTRTYRAGYSSTTPEQMKRFADTVAHEIYISPGTYAGTVNRSGARTYNFLPAGFMYLALYNHDVYKQAADADMKSGKQAGSADVEVSILWVKHQLAKSP